ncbi:MAG: hypothetical protein KBS57_05835, partial [Alistipes sp.]|nr:hypothetical protein [Candidatus Minthomonas equi]
MAWFSEDVTRAMLLHTKVFGPYRDDKMDHIAETACYTELNLTKNYVPVSEVKIQVVDEDNRPIPEARIEFRLYNFAEFYPVIKSVTDKDGCASATFGNGDILVWASNGERYGYRKIAVGKNTECKRDGNFLRRLFECVSGGKQKTVTVILSRKEGDGLEDQVDIFPPSGVEVTNSVTRQETEVNEERLAREDSIRTAYQSTFHSGDNANKYAVMACGNSEEIVSFIFFNTSTEQRKICAQRMMDLMNEKDLRDSQCDVLMDYILNYFKLKNVDSSVSEYLLNPRVSNEMLSPCSSFFREHFGDSLSVENIMEITSKIEVMDSQNPAGIPVSPIGVAGIGVADSHSRDIFFVSVCR